MARENDIRRAKGNLVRDIAEQQKRGGIATARENHAALRGNAVPDVSAIEEYLAPILEKVERSTTTTALETAEQRDTHRHGDTYEHAGEYEWNLGADTLTALNGAEIPRPPSSANELVQNMVRRLLRMPEWAAKFHEARALCGHHAVLPRKGCGNCSYRERKIRDLIAAAVRAYGDPRSSRSPAIIVGA